MWRKSLISKDASIHDAIVTIDTGSYKIALVVDTGNHLIGTITDGDIRRAILRGVGLDQPVSKILNANPTTARSNDDRETITALMKEREVQQIPLIDEQGCIAGMEEIDAIIQSEKFDNWVVLMAGGEGLRLRPLTAITAKPMLQVGGKPLLESTLKSFIRQGFHKFYFSVNYKSEQFENYFSDGAKWNAEIRYLHEDKPLGTAGPLSLIPETPKHPTLVMNGDLLTDVNFRSLLTFHREQKSIATMGVREFDMEVPFGVVNIEGEKIISIDEKPSQTFLVNAGIYVLDPAVMKLIPKNQRTDMPEVFDRVIASDSNTAVFPIREYWLDMGHPEQYQIANRDIDRLFD